VAAAGAASALSTNVHTLITAIEVLN